MKKYDLILINGKAVTPSGIIKTNIAVKNGKIVDIGNISSEQADEIIDCDGLHILPGVIDSQTHMREPGNTHKEDLESGTRAAVMGGITSVFEMPNTNPLTTTIAAMAEKVRLAREKAWCSFAFYVGGTKENAHELSELENLEGCCGTKIFMGSSTGNLLASEDETIRKVLQNGTKIVAVHAEDEPRLIERFDLVKDGADVNQHPVWRDEETAIKATRRILRISKETGRNVHVLHITTGQEIDLLAEHKDHVTVEITPQHLTLAAPNCYDEIGSLAQMNPPIREQHHQDKLWQAINNGVADIIGSDHAPHSLEEKNQAYPKSPSGMPGVQTLVPIMLNHVNNGKLSLERLVDLVCHAPHRIFKLRSKGRLVVGYDADFTIVDMNEKRIIKNEWIESKCGWTPYAGMEVKGWVNRTIINGQTIMFKDSLVQKPQAKPLEFWNS